MLLHTRATPSHEWVTEEMPSEFVVIYDDSDVHATMIRVSNHLSISLKLLPGSLRRRHRRRTKGFKQFYPHHRTRMAGK